MFTNYSLFEEKGEPKRNRAEALLLTSRTPYRSANAVSVLPRTGGRRTAEHAVGSVSLSRAGSGLCVTRDGVVYLV